MAAETANLTLADERTEFGLLAEFPDPESLMHACAKVRDAGFTCWDAHTPFPVHGLDKAMGLKRSMVSAFVAGTRFVRGGGRHVAAILDQCFGLPSHHQWQAAFQLAGVCADHV